MSTNDLVNDRLEMRRRFEELSLSERNILSLMLDGFTNVEISRTLEICLRTIEYRRASAFEKMGGKTVAEVVKNLGIAFGAELSSRSMLEPPRLRRDEVTEELLEAARAAHRILLVAVRENVNVPDFDANEHVVVKRLAKAIANATATATEPELAASC